MGTSRYSRESRRPWTCDWERTWEGVLWDWAVKWEVCTNLRGRYPLNFRTHSWYLESWRTGWCGEKKKNLHTFGVRSAGSKNSSWRRRRNPPLILHFTHVTGSKSRGSASPRGPGSNAADGRCQHLQCFAPSRNTSMCICISSSWQPFEIGAIFASISISSYIILFSDVKCFLPLKQKPVSGFVGIQTK